MPLDSPATGAAIGLVAGVVAAVRASYRAQPAIVTCRKIDKQLKQMTLRAAPTWRATLERENPGALRR